MVMEATLRARLRATKSIPANKVPTLYPRSNFYHPSAGYFAGGVARDSPLMLEDTPDTQRFNVHKMHLKRDERSRTFEVCFFFFLFALFRRKSKFHEIPRYRVGFLVFGETCFGLLFARKPPRDRTVAVNFVIKCKRLLEFAKFALSNAKPTTYQSN